MCHSSRLQISNLERIESIFVQELTLEETEKIVGGNSKIAIKNLFSNILVADLQEGYTNTFKFYKQPSLITGC